MTKRNEQYKASRVVMPMEYFHISRRYYLADNEVMRRLSEILTKRNEQYKASRVVMPMEYFHISRRYYLADN
ncbi:MAG: hypothetical protein IJP16_06060, partial [Clostridia bacterium]|nr:hypothetical protein [Clostridia bacterium]